jgi:hypothetical protein
MEIIMNHRLASALSFGSAVAAAMLAAAAMTGNARAEGPIGDNTPFVSSRSRADVHAELMRDRHLVTSAASEWTGQLNAPQGLDSGYTRAQARAEYIAARDEVRAMTAEHGGSGHFAYAPVRTPDLLIARNPAH